MNNLQTGAVIYILLVLSAFGVWFMLRKYGRKALEFVRNKNLVILLLIFIQFLLIFYCSIIITLCLATLLFGFVFPYSGKVIPPVFILGVSALLLVYALNTSKMASRFNKIFGGKETIKQDNNLIYDEEDKAGPKEEGSKLLFFNIKFIAVTFALSLSVNITGRLACDGSINELRKEGYAMSFKELASPVPPGKNAAHALQELSLKSPPKESYIESEIYKDANYPDVYRPDKWTSGQKKTFRDFLKGNRKYIKFADIIENSDYYRFTDYANVTGTALDMEYPNMAGILPMCRQFSMASKMAMLEGNAGQAARFDGLIARTAVFISSEKSLISEMVALACVKHGLTDVYSMVNFYAPDYSIAQKAAAGYGFIRERDLVRQGMEYELAWAGEVYRSTLGSGKGKHYSVFDAVVGMSNAFEFMLIFTIPSGMFYPGFPIDLKMKAAMINGDFSAITAGKVKALSIWPNIFAEVAIPNFSGMFDRQKEYRFRLDLVRVLIAAKKYYMSAGRMPKSPDELMSFGLKKDDITDPFSKEGAQLKFRQNQDGLVIYSIGYDKVDNGGDLEKDAGCVLWK